MQARTHTDFMGHECPPPPSLLPPSPPSPSWDYLKQAELGHGNFAKVFRVVHRLTGAAFAVKTNRHPIQTLTQRNQWLNVRA